LLLICSAVFAGSEIALISLREGQLRHLERHSRSRRTLVKLARDPNRFLATVQIGITLAGFLASATTAVALAEPLVPYLSFLGAAARPVAVVAIALVLTFVTLVTGEPAPKRLAMQYARRWALLVARPLHVVSVAAGPAVWLRGRPTDAVVRILGGDPSVLRDEITPAEIRNLVAAHRGHPRTAADHLRRVGDHPTAAAAGMLLRRAVFTLDADTPVPAARDLLAASGHSRAPVVRHGSLDDTVGVGKLRDLVRGTWRRWPSWPARRCFYRTAVRGGGASPVQGRPAAVRAGGRRARGGQRLRHPWRTWSRR
jgi:putative hemolysin